MDTTTRTIEREAQGNPSIETYAKLRAARLRAGLEPLPERKLAVMDPLHLVPLRERVEKLNKVADKRGYHPLLLIEAHDARYVERQRPDGSTCWIRVRDVQIVGDVPDTGVWRYLARLEHAPSGTIIHRSASTAEVSDEVLERYRGRGPACDHCDARRKRNDTFVVRNRETGETAQVGRSCLEAYLGSTPEGSLWAFDNLAAVTQLAIDYADLKDAPEALRGAPLAVFAAFLIDGETPRSAWVRSVSTSQPHVTDGARAEAIALVKRAAEALVPSLMVSRAQALALDAGMDFEWPSNTPKLPERWHNLAVVIAEGFVPQHLAEVAAQVVEWRDEQARVEAEAEQRAVSTDPVIAAGFLAGTLRQVGCAAVSEHGVISLSASDLAKLLLLSQDAGQQAAAHGLRSAARTVLGLDAPAANLNDPSRLATTVAGTEGRWLGRVAVVRPFHRGPGATVEVMVGDRQAVVFLRGGEHPPVGAQVVIAGRIEAHGRSPITGRGQTEFARGTRLERA